MTFRRDIRESRNFTQQLVALGDRFRLDDALIGVETLISMNAEAFPKVSDNPKAHMFRIAKTEPYRGLPAFRIVFEIVDENLVEMHAIETIPEER